MQFNLAMSSLNHIPALLKKIPWEPGQINLDVGGGRFDKATNYLKDLGVENIVIDPHARSLEHNYEAASRLTSLGRADSATLSNVLCVIREKKKRLDALRFCCSMLKPGGKLYVSIYAGDGTGRGKSTKSKTWQNNRPLRTYLKEIKEIFPNACLEKGFISSTKEAEDECGTRTKIV